MKGITKRRKIAILAVAIGLVGVMQLPLALHPDRALVVANQVPTEEQVMDKASAFPVLVTGVVQILQLLPY